MKATFIFKEKDINTGIVVRTVAQAIECKNLFDGMDKASVICRHANDFYKGRRKVTAWPK